MIDDKKKPHTFIEKCHKFKKCWELHITVTIWLFTTWRIDILRSLSLIKGHVKFLIFSLHNKCKSSFERM